MSRAGLAALLGLCVAGLITQARATQEVSSNNPKTPGNPDYWVKLQSLDVSEGALHPDFHEDRESYELKISNILTKSVTLTLGINLDKYDLLHTPVIEVDGHKLEYTPLTIIADTIPLNDDIGPFDREISIVVRDPNKGTWLNPTNRKEYKIHITQPAEQGKVVMAEALILKAIKEGEAGQEVLEADPPFNPNSTAADYYYNIHQDYTSVIIEFDCSKWVSKVLFNQHEEYMQAPEAGMSPKGCVEHIDVTKFTQKQFALACIYQDEQGKDYRKDYMLTLARDIKLSSHLVRPALMHDAGFCMSRMDYMSRLQSHYLHAQSLSSDENEGYFCLSNLARPRVMLDSSNRLAEQAEVLLIAHGAPFQTPLRCFLPVEVPHHYARHQFTMSVRLGTHHLTFPVNFIFAAECLTMICPIHYTQRLTLRDEVNAEKRLCMSELCTEETDLETCCEETARCNTMDCGADNTPDSAFDCSGPVCQQADYDHCCLRKPTCTDFDCPVGTTLRIHHATLYCTGDTCTEEDDTDICCEKQAPCSDFVRDFQCSSGETPPEDVDERHCMWATCSHMDMLHCCGDVATCEGFECPAGEVLRSDAAKLTCFGPICKKTDANKCCIKAAMEGKYPVIPKKGVVSSINDDGTYAVNYTDGTIDDRVPEWALHSSKSDSPIMKPGDEIIANTAEDGYHHHTFCSGWVQKANHDGSYMIKFDNGDFDIHVPAWAVRAVDAQGNRFVHTGMLAKGQRVITSRRKKGGYTKFQFAVGAVIATHNDSTFDIEYPSGDEDEHVPVWSLRLVDSEGYSHVSPNYKAGQYVEVAGHVNANENIFQPGLRDQLRTNFMFGYVRKVNADQTYGIKYDFGGWEDGVPVWAIRHFEDGRSIRKIEYKSGDRVEARVSIVEQERLTNYGVGRLGIAVRERLHLYEKLNCWPAPGECKDMVKLPAGVPPDTPQTVPNISSYDIVRNPDDLKLCYYDFKCKDEPEAPGCAKTGGDRPLCRYCGFGEYDPCPEPYFCNATDKHESEDWSADKKDWCCKYFNIGCPYVCRWGKYWPQEAHGWGPWWTPEKRTWCCENKEIGCPRLEFALITTVVTTTVTAACSDAFALIPVDEGDCPEDVSSLHPCEQAEPGSLCKGTGGCGTSLGVNNCHESEDIYQKQARPCPDDEGVQGYRYSHDGFWFGGEDVGSASSAADCGAKCDQTTSCLAISWKQDQTCTIYTELASRVLGSVATAFLRCPKPKMLDLSMKYAGDASRQHRQAGDNTELAAAVFRHSGLTLSSSEVSFVNNAWLVPVGVVSTLAVLAWTFRRPRRQLPTVRGVWVKSRSRAEEAPNCSSSPRELGDVENRPLL